MLSLMRRYSLDEVPFEPVSHDPALKKQVLVDNGVLPGIRNVSHIEIAPGSRASEHSHPDGHEVFYCIKGRITFRVNGSVVVLRKGQCLIVEPGETHSIENTATRTELVYFFLKSPLP